MSLKLKYIKQSATGARKLIKLIKITAIVLSTLPLTKKDARGGPIIIQAKNAKIKSVNINIKVLLLLDKFNKNFILLWKP